MQISDDAFNRDVHAVHFEQPRAAQQMQRRASVRDRLTELIFEATQQCLGDARRV